MMSAKVSMEKTLLYKWGAPYCEETIWDDRDTYALNREDFRWVKDKYLRLNPRPTQAPFEGLPGQKSRL